MKGLLGAATVIGSLMNGAGHVYQGHTNFYPHHGSPLMMPSLATCSLGAAAYRRQLCLHCRGIARSCYAPAVASYRGGYLESLAIQHQPVRTNKMRHLTDIPEMQRMVPMMPRLPPGHRVPPRCRRFVYGYVLDPLMALS